MSYMNTSEVYQLNQAEFANFSGMSYHYCPRKEHNIKAWKEMLFVFWTAEIDGGVPLWRLIGAVPEDHPTSTAESYVRWIIKQGYIIPFVETRKAKAA